LRSRWRQRAEAKNSSKAKNTYDENEAVAIASHAADSVMGTSIYCMIFGEENGG